MVICIKDSKKRYLCFLLVLIMLFIFCIPGQESYAFAGVLTLSGATKIVGVLLASAGCYEIVKNNSSLVDFTNDFLDKLGGVDKGLLLLSAGIAKNAAGELVIRSGEIKDAFNSALASAISFFEYAGKAGAGIVTDTVSQLKSHTVSGLDEYNDILTNVLPSMHKTNVESYRELRNINNHVVELSLTLDNINGYILNGPNKVYKLIESVQAGAYTFNIYMYREYYSGYYLYFYLEALKYGKVLHTGSTTKHQIGWLGGSDECVTLLLSIFLNRSGNQMAFVNDYVHYRGKSITDTKKGSVYFDDKIFADELTYAGDTIAYNPDIHVLPKSREIPIPLDKGYAGEIEGVGVIDGINTLPDDYDDILGRVDGKPVNPTKIKVNSDGIVEVIDVPVTVVANPPAPAVDHTGILNKIKLGIDGILDFLKDILNKILDFLKKIWDKLKEIASAVSQISVLQAIKAKLDTIIDKLASTGSVVLDLPKTLFDIPKDKSIDWQKLKTTGFEKTFPFCIPWDLYNSIKIFAVQAKDPHISIDLNTKYFNINHNVDLSPFTFYISFFRYFCIAFFTFNLAKKSKEVIF